MYQKLTADDFRKHYKFPDDYQVSGLLVMGHWDRPKFAQEAKEHIRKVFGKGIEIEELTNEFFASIVSFVVDGKRYWFDTVYGQTYLSELVHVACLFGSKRNILIGKRPKTI